MSRILIVEDEPNVRANLVEILQLMDFDVRGAADGLEGIEVAKAFKPDLLLCDVRMPRADGFAVLQAIRKDPELTGSIVIMLTAHTDSEMRQRGIAEGANAFLTKPIAVDDLMNAMQRFLSEAPVSDT